MALQDLLTSVPTWVFYLCVFALPFLEASIFLGFVLPGETALVFGGVLSSQGHTSLLVVLILAVLGAILGDSVGYAVGLRYGGGLQKSRLGQRIGDSRWQLTESFLQRRGAPAVFFGRWTAVLRAMVPAAAGMSKMHYRTFLLWNVIGGTAWAVACVIGGYAVGDVIGRVVSGAGYAIAAIVVAVAVVHVVKKRRARSAEGPPAGLPREGATSDLSES